MRKAKVPAANVRQQLIDAAEQMLLETHGRRLVMSELASRVGLTQSHAHNFFATKDDLVRALAARWFEDVESRIMHAVSQKHSPEDRLKSYVLETLRVKRAKFDANPELFRSYLVLASEHLDMVQAHANRLATILEDIVTDLKPPMGGKRATELVQDATVLFRVPHNISLFRATTTDQRAEAVVNAILVALKRV